MCQELLSKNEMLDRISNARIHGQSLVPASLADSNIMWCDGKPSSEYPEDQLCHWRSSAAWQGLFFQTFQSSSPYSITLDSLWSGAHPGLPVLHASPRAGSTSAGKASSLPQHPFVECLLSAPSREKDHVHSLIVLNFKWSKQIINKIILDSDKSCQGNQHSNVIESSWGRKARLQGRHLWKDDIK